MRKHFGVAAVIGFNVGLFWVLLAYPSLEPSSLFKSTWNPMVWASCPPIVVGIAPWWLVPILNAILYGTITIVAGVLLRLVRPFVR